jgi:hypothetical protein
VAFSSSGREDERAPEIRPDWSRPMARRTTRPELTPEQQAESDRIFTALQQAAAADLREVADLLATKDDSSTFGAAELTVRDIVLRVGAKAVETALEGRKKGGTTGPAAPAPTAPNPPSSSAGSPGPS